MGASSDLASWKFPQSDIVLVTPNQESLDCSTRTKVYHLYGSHHFQHLVPLFLKWKKRSGNMWFKGELSKGSQKLSSVWRCFVVDCWKHAKKTEGRSVQGGENGGFLQEVRSTPKSNSTIRRIHMHIHSEIQVICGFEHSFQTQTCQINHL